VGEHVGGGGAREGLEAALRVGGGHPEQERAEGDLPPAQREPPHGRPPPREPPVADGDVGPGLQRSEEAGRVGDGRRLVHVGEEHGGAARGLHARDDGGGLPGVDDPHDAVGLGLRQRGRPVVAPVVHHEQLGGEGLRRQPRPHGAELPRTERRGLVVGGDDDGEVHARPASGRAS
jgi:hypothetical protein